MEKSEWEQWKMCQVVIFKKLPDVFRVTAAQEEGGTVIGCVKLGETHEVHQVIGDGL